MSAEAAVKVEEKEETRKVTAKNQTELSIITPHIDAVEHVVA